MKKIRSLCFLVLLFTACKKDNNSKQSECNVISAISGNKMEYDAQGKLVKFNTTGADYITVSYENNNKTLTETFSAAFSRKSQLDDKGLPLSTMFYDNAGKLSSGTTTVRDVNGYKTQVIFDTYAANGGVAKREVITYVNTFDTDGNLIKQVLKQTGKADFTRDYIYDKSKPSLKFIFSGVSLLYSDDPQPKNILTKERDNGVDSWVYTYTTDAKGRLTYNKITGLISGANGSEATITYQCD
ncbi:MAG: hypothetical protein ABJC98_13270 [Bacteroidota bacterium]